MTNKVYDFEQARKKIEELKKAKELKITSAYLAISEDYSWTAEEVWNADEGYLMDLQKQIYVAGIAGSYWGTPVLQTYFEDGSFNKVAVFKEVSDEEYDEICIKVRDLIYREIK